jgi:hypothetical protein
MSMNPEQLAETYRNNPRIQMWVAALLEAWRKSRQNRNSEPNEPENEIQSQISFEISDDELFMLPDDMYDISNQQLFLSDTSFIMELPSREPRDGTFFIPIPTSLIPRRNPMVMPQISRTPRQTKLPVVVIDSQIWAGKNWQNDPGPKIQGIHRRAEICERRIHSGQDKEFLHPAQCVIRAQEYSDLRIRKSEAELARNYATVNIEQKYPNFWPVRSWEEEKNRMDADQSARLAEIVERIVNQTEVLVEINSWQRKKRKNRRTRDHAAVLGKQRTSRENSDDETAGAEF